MAFIDPTDIKPLYEQAKTESKIWKEDYPQYERLMDNGLMEGLDENLPEVNDGSLAAALFKLPKRVVSKKLSGTVSALDRDEAWLSELANLQWRNEIIPYANTQAPFIRKWKDAVRKAAGYGGVPLITIFIERDGKRTTDFIVAQPHDVRLEPGKVSDCDSDVLFWDVYYTKTQLRSMIDEAKLELDEAKADKTAESYNKWDIEALEKIYESGAKESRTGVDSPTQLDNKVKPEGFKFVVVVQRGVDAPFYMYHSGEDVPVRTWTNPDPTGDVPIHYLYCYQDLVNPYGIGIVKLAGGTQNVLDYMRQADVLATQIGLRPPVALEGNTDDTDFDSIVYAQDAVWELGGATLNRQELADGVYQALPGRVQMYQASLQKLIPTGDTSLSMSQSGDTTQSKTPAGVKLAAANLSIDDEDFKDNLYETYAVVAKSMINTHFANMEGEDLLKLTDDEREILIKAGLTFPQGEDGEMSNQLEIEWDTVRAKFDFVVDPEVDKTADDATKLEGLVKVAELVASDPNITAELASVGKKLNKGELFSEIIKLTSDNDKIISDISPDEQQLGPDGQPIDPTQVAAQQAQEQQIQLQDAQKQIETLTEQLRVAKQVPYKEAPETVKEQMEQEAGYDRQGVLSVVEEGLVQEEQKFAHTQSQSEHQQNMDMVNAVDAPQPKVAQNA